MKSAEIEKMLMHDLFFKHHSPIVKHFSGAGLGECDVLSITQSGMVYEYEIKISRSDYKADFKKTFKHKILSNHPEIQKYYYANHKPNFFYYVVPEGLITIKELPEYAGLIYCKVSDRTYEGYEIIKIKNAPKLFKDKASMELYQSIMRNLTAKTIFNGYATVDRQLLKSSSHPEENKQ